MKIKKNGGFKKMEQRENDLLYIVKKLQEDKTKNGVVLSASAYDEEKNMWHNIRLYFPFPVEVEKDENDKKEDIK